MKDSLLELAHVSFAYEDGTFELRDISVSIRQGERIAVLGNNGAGKSTFFLLCNGVLQPDSGTLSLEGSPVNLGKRSALYKLRQRVGIVFQDPNQQLIGSTVESEISFGPMNLKLPKAEVARQVDEAMAAMRITQYRDRPVHYLSGGEKKRVTIADVLAMEPEIVMLDEPTASLDLISVGSLEEALAQLTQQGKTLLISTHDVDFAWRWAQRILVFHAGALIADDTPEAIFSDADMLARAGLRKPYLYDFGLYLKTHCGWDGDAWPRLIEDLC